MQQFFAAHVDDRRWRKLTIFFAPQSTEKKCRPGPARPSRATDETCSLDNVPKKQGRLPSFINLVGPMTDEKNGETLLPLLVGIDFFPYDRWTPYISNDGHLPQPLSRATLTVHGLHCVFSCQNTLNRPFSAFGKRLTQNRWFSANC